MDISTTFIRIVFLVIPGIIASKFYSKFVGNNKDKDLDYFLEIIVFSVLSYALYDTSIYYLWKFKFLKSYTCIFDVFFNIKIPVDLRSIIIVSLIGIFLAFIASFFRYRKLINKAGQFIGITNRYGDEDVWEYFFNSPNISWVYVRDHKYNLVYMGYISKFSDSKQKRELLLEDVTVYSQPKVKKLYELDAIYLSRESNELTIELPQRLSPKKFNKWVFIFLIISLFAVFIVFQSFLYKKIESHWYILITVSLSLIIVLTTRAYFIAKQKNDSKEEYDNGENK